MEELHKRKLLKGVVLQGRFLQALCTWKAMQDIIQSKEGESCKEYSRLHSLRFVGTGTDKITWRCSLFCHFHGLLFTEDLGLLHAGEIRSLCEIQRMEGRSSESNKVQDQVLA